MRVYGVKFFKGACVLVFLWLLGLICFIYHIPSSAQDPTVTTDGIVVFTGGKTRLRTALALFQQKKGRYLLISGANPGSPFKDIVGQIPEAAHITLGYEASDTSGNARETAAWVKINHIKTLRLITSNYHMPRSLFELRHLLPSVQIFPQPVIGDNFTRFLWWARLSTLALVIQEYHKFLFSFFHHLYDDTKKCLR